jgi:serine/threonine protein kinase
MPSGLTPLHVEGNIQAFLPRLWLRPCPPMRVCPLCSTQTDALLCPKDGTATIRPRSTQVLTLPIEGDVVAGRYRIEGILGRGGFGAVYRVLHTGTGQHCALKVLALGAGDDASVIRRFFAEARVTAGLKHVNTVRVFDFGQDDHGWYFLAMELLEGASLADILRHKTKRAEAMTEVAAARIGISVLRSLMEAHAAGLVHRDLKPHNIFLHEVHGEEPVVKVLDFGIAKSSEFSLTLANQALGTPTYMSPEQCQSVPMDGRSDLYSLGCILYQMVVGVPPFRADNLAALVMKHVSEVAPDVRHAARTVISDAFAAVVAKALRKNASDRFASALEMRDALRACLGETVPVPRPVSDAPSPRPNGQAQTPETVAYVTDAAVDDTTGLQRLSPQKPEVDATRAQPRAPMPGLAVSLAPEPGSQPTAVSGPPSLMPATPLPVPTPQTGPMPTAPDRRPTLLIGAGVAVAAVLAFVVLRGPAEPVAVTAQAGLAAPTPASSPTPAVAQARAATPVAAVAVAPAPVIAPVAPAPAAEVTPAPDVSVRVAAPDRLPRHAPKRRAGPGTGPASSPPAAGPKEDRL